jgi:hypothetical protein
LRSVVPDLAQLRKALGDRLHDEARAEVVAMSRQEALAFVLQHL